MAVSEIVRRDARLASTMQLERGAIARNTICLAVCMYSGYVDGHAGGCLNKFAHAFHAILPCPLLVNSGYSL